jgi:hypothetical protein
MRYTGRVPGRPRPAAPEAESPTEPDCSAEAWCAIYRAKADRTEQVQVAPDATDAEILRAWRGAHMRASEIPVRASRRGTLA